MLVLTFDRQLDPDSAGNPNNYLIYSPAPGRRIGTAHDRLVPILSGVYNSANKTVTLVMAKPLYLHGQYRIVVRGTGSHPITDLNGVPLDGKTNGVPGTNFTTIFGREILVGITPGWLHDHQPRRHLPRSKRLAQPVTSIIRSGADPRVRWIDSAEEQRSTLVENLASSPRLSRSRLPAWPVRASCRFTLRSLARRRRFMTRHEPAITSVSTARITHRA